MASPAPASPAKKKKNLPFKRTTARKKSPDPFSDDRQPGKANIGVRGGCSNNHDYDDDDDDGLSMFRRRNEVFPLAIEEQERRLRREEIRKKASTPEQEEPEEPAEPGSKRRRISTNWESDHDLSSSGGRRDSKRVSTPRSASRSVHSKTVSPLARFGDIKKDVKGKGKEVMRSEDPQSPTVSRTRNMSDLPVSLDDDDDDLEIAAAPKAIRKTETTRPVLIVDDGDDPFTEERDVGRQERKASFSDDDDLVVVEDPPDEFAKYILAAREREAKANAAKASISEVVDNTNKGAKGATNSNDTSLPVDASIKVMVTSVLPDTIPMVAKIKLTQAISVVRGAWFDHQKKKAGPIPEDLQGQIFLTWKGNRIYNTITCASLGIEVDAQGRVRWDTYHRDEAGYHNGGLHFQAWTEELYADHIKKKERERLRRLGELDEDSDSVVINPAETEQVEEGPQPIKVTLKAKNCEPLNTKVHMHTTVETMVSVFRELRNIPAEKEAALYFDGEKLDAATTVEDAGIEDMDNLEVHIK